MAWSDILGQALAVQQLRGHLAAGRVPGAYLLSGPEGVGKRRLALEMAKALNCAAGGSEACDACPSCRHIHQTQHPDVHTLEPGGPADQIRMDAMRYVLGRIALRPYSARYQVVLLHGAERLNEEAANSLLKSLEEPSPHTRFLLTTPRLSHCLPTIASRCQLVRCVPLPAALVRRLLVEQGCEPRVAEMAALRAGGSLATAAALARQWAGREALLARLAGPPDAWLEQPLPETRQDVALLLEEMVGWVRDVAVAAATGSAPGAAAAHAAAIQRHAGGADPQRCARAAAELVQLRESLEQFVSPKMVASLAREAWLDLFAAASCPSR